VTQRREDIFRTLRTRLRELGYWASEGDRMGLCLTLT
jgi:hypothetical protein